MMNSYTSVLQQKSAIFYDWKPLYLFNFYRIFIAVSLMLLMAADVAPDFITKEGYSLFSKVDFVYLMFGIYCDWSIERRHPSLSWQIFSQFLFDIAAISLLMYASGGVSSGLGVLLVTAVAGASLLAEGLLAFFFAAMASISVLMQVTFMVIYDSYWMQGTTVQNNYVHAGMLGVSFFATAFLGQTLSKRIRISEELAKQRGRYLEYLAQLNAQIVQNILSGIIVVDKEGLVRLFNENALHLLGVRNLINGHDLHVLAPELASQLEEWQNVKYAFSKTFHSKNSGVDIITTFIELDRGGESHILIMLEDSSFFNQRATQLKLTSLANLAASIAHEIRNPIAIVTQAGQLLTEELPETHPSHSLVKMILHNTARVNTIIENILQISRGGSQNVLSFDLNTWLIEFISEFQLHNHLEEYAVLCMTYPTDVIVCFDKVQLFQVINNICENGLRYSQQMPYLTLKMGIDPILEIPYLDICDSGSGMRPETAKQIFEPFFTTESKGSGLGLYVARELCNINRAFLQLVENTEHGCCFRIHFSRIIFEKEMLGRVIK